ncbi:hypothetical protein FH972_021629 [Carpinus fangiana]|uniref:Uncharacterized protein n=1 Tax=Carpinus fangiana TaxID=176857 RepID=A0A5N6KQI6_9ROSI|nr:hypothetical protein FH972_021629 [Carpinus fangiana]
MPGRQHIDYLQREYDSHPSLAASLEDFETPLQEPTDASQAFEFSPRRQSTLSPAPTTIRSPDMDSDAASTDSTGPWSPPAWRRNPSGWFPHNEAAHSPSRSRETSPLKDTTAPQDEDTTLAADVPLPGSPVKGRSPSPTHETAPEEGVLLPAAGAQRENYIRFAVRAEVQHRTEPIEAAIVYVRKLIDRVTTSKITTFTFLTSIIVAWLMFRNLIQPPDSGPGPDLIKVAGLARSFEPLIHYSEHGSQQIGDLQETGVAVWDLSESVRYSNMTSAPIIVKELDDLSESLKELSLELTRFFSNVDGDIDNILIVMEWAKRELLQVSGHIPGSIGSALENISLFVSKVGGPSVEQVMQQVIGRTHSQLTKAALHRTFNEFLNTLEESINSELRFSTSLFAHFEAIDRQFLNLQRSVLRETDTQEAQHDAELASLWRRLLGANSARVAKFEKNKKLLMSVKERTVQNKLVLVDHNGKLLKLKSNLEILRKRLISPLVRANDSSTLTVEEQIAGLDGTYEYLKEAREKQKGKMMERLYGAGRRRPRAADEDLMLDEK